MTNQLVLGLGIALLAGGSALAQVMTFNVPFPFQAEKSMLPAGEYTVDTSINPHVVHVRSADFKSAAMLLSHSIESRKTSTRGTLVFNRYGDTYFLSQVWKPGTNTGRTLRKSKREIELASNLRSGQQTLLTLK